MNLVGQRLSFGGIRDLGTSGGCVDRQPGINPLAGRRLPRGRLAAWLAVAVAVGLVALRLDRGLAPKDAGTSAVAALVAFGPGVSGSQHAADAATRHRAAERRPRTAAPLTRPRGTAAPRR